MTKTYHRRIPSKERAPFPSIFFTLLPPSDVEMLRRQARLAKGERRFSPALAIGAAHRCRHGCPQVVLCGALRRREPFPTSLWLTCPHLLREIGMAEAAGGVPAMERYLAALPDGAAEWRRWHSRHALLRLALMGEREKAFLRAHRRGLYRAICRGGVGGISYTAGDVFVKCLHLQFASYLGVGWHPAAAWLDANIRSRECGAGTCLAPAR